MRTLLLAFCASALFAQNSNTYLGPKEDASKSRLVRVEVRVNDGPEQGGLQIQGAQFDGQTIPLKPRDVHGYRGGASFQKEPGNYTLSWVVNRDKYAWPRNARHEEIVNISPRDLWIQVIIEGENVSIR